MNHPSDHQEIEFVFDTKSIKGFDENVTRQWITAAIENEAQSAGVLQFIFTNDNRLLQINRDYLNHDTFTDIITFNYNDEYLGVSGDIFISLERVEENAQEYGVSFDEELHRVIIHGVLHLLGYDDQDDTSQRVMRTKENYYLSLLT